MKSNSHLGRKTTYLRMPQRNEKGHIYRTTKSALTWNIQVNIQEKEKCFLMKSGSLLIVDNGAGNSALLSQFKANIKVNVNVHEHYVLI